MNPGDKELVLITGGSGLIGSRLAALVSGEYQVIGLDKAPNMHTSKLVENIGFDITDDASIESACERIKHVYGDKVASVVHLAAYYNFNGEESPLYEAITIEGTRRLMNHLKSHFNITQFFFSSTNLIYSPTKPGQPVDENAPLDPDWAYPRSKKTTEDLIRENRDDLKVVIGRIAGVYDDWCHSIPISHQIARIYEKSLKGHLYAGNTEKGNPFIHLKDLTRALKAIIDRRNELEEWEVINISEPKTYSYGSLQDRIGELIHGKEWTTIELPKPLAKAGAALEDSVRDPFIKPWMIDRAEDHYEFKIDKAGQLLGWQPKHDIYADLETIINHLKENPEKWFQVNGLDIPKNLN